MEYILGWFSSKLDKLAANRLDEQLYAQVAQEIIENRVRPGLWTKAWALSRGNETEARTRYIELRAKQLRLELGASRELAEAAARNSSPLGEAAPQKPATACPHCGGKNIARRSDNGMLSWCFDCSRAP